MPSTWTSSIPVQREIPQECEKLDKKAATADSRGFCI